MKTAEQIELVFGTGASLGLSYTVLELGREFGHLQK